MFGIYALTAVHTLISIVALVLGLVATAALFRTEMSERWTTAFLVFAALASLTGFLFPFTGVTPAFAVGIVACAVLVATVAARHVYDLAGRWRDVYALGIVVSAYLLVFVTIAQAFDKVPGLMVLAPGGAGPVFGLSEAAGLAVFVAIGYRALRRGRRRVA